MKKSSNFWQFLCNLVPGALEMEYGFMKNGSTLLLVFILAIFIPSFLYIDELMLLSAFVVYVYAFFHARRLRKMDEEELKLKQDIFIWDEFTGSHTKDLPQEKMRKYTGIAALVLGVIGLFKMAEHILIDYAAIEKAHPIIAQLMDLTPDIIFSILIIVVGILLIRGKKENL